MTYVGIWAVATQPGILKLIGSGVIAFMILNGILEFRDLRKRRGNPAKGAEDRKREPHWLAINLALAMMAGMIIAVYVQKMPDDDTSAGPLETPKTIGRLVV